MSIFTAELTGTALLLLLGNGVVANVVLPQSKGQGGGWIVISFGWAMAVFVGVYLSAPVSGAHLNPAVSLAMAALGKISWAQLPVYLAAQLLGAMLGSLAVWAVYHRHLLACNDAGLKQALFCTAPAIPHTISNLLSEAVGTFVLVYAVLHIAAPASSLGALDALPVALLVLAIGLSLGGPTGYAINPARDLGPRIMHALLPMGTKGSSNWAYAWIPVVGPVAGSLLAVALWLW